MWVVYSYVALLAGCCGYGLLRGGAPERAAAAAMLAGSLVSPLIAPAGTSYRHLELGLFLVDLSVQLALTLIALFADRFWPMAVAGMHLLTVLVSVAKVMVPQVQPVVYWRSEQACSFLILIVIAAGTRRHRVRMARYGADPPWSRFSEISTQA